MNESSEIKVTRIEACKRQLETAIWLYFTGGDPVSIHTLAASAVEAVRAAAAAKGVMNLRNMTDLVVKPAYRKKVHKKIKEAEGFFKHGGTNEKEQHVFDRGQTDHVLLDGCLTYEGLSGPQTPLMKTFTWWFIMNNPDIYNTPPEDDEWFKTLVARPLPTKDKYFQMACVAFRLGPQATGPDAGEDRGVTITRERG
ncbi:MAG: hypothetical protein ABSD58_11580 [Verrucomicrobiia bacterium]|jgi:hypothetical protein